MRFIPAGAGNTRRVLASLGIGLRFIPAGAGNTKRGNECGQRLAVHPRGRGEHLLVSAALCGFCGSSPRARGTHQCHSTARPCSRFIPAGAGNTSADPMISPKMAVHPRGRGEHVPSTLPVIGFTGSSPRARGTQFSQRRFGQVGRFIPAGAGNTSEFDIGPNPTPVHPRGRGEHSPCLAVVLRRFGSSPRARGTHESRRPGPSIDRFIPAGAGNTARSSPPKGHNPVHPRGRGEHSTDRKQRGETIGSSPRARGTLVAHSFLLLAIRFIPAGAGNTWSSVQCEGYNPVHPRGRGEHIMIALGVGMLTGSSPRARGTHFL